MWKMAATSTSVFRNLDCLSLFAYSKYNSAGISNFIVFIFFQNLRFQIGSAAYLRMRLIHGRLRYIWPARNDTWPSKNEFDRSSWLETIRKLFWALMQTFQITKCSVLHAKRKYSLTLDNFSLPAAGPKLDDLSLQMSWRPSPKDFGPSWTKLTFSLFNRHFFV